MDVGDAVKVGFENQVGLELGVILGCKITSFFFNGFEKRII